MSLRHGPLAPFLHVPPPPSPPQPPMRPPYSPNISLFDYILENGFRNEQDENAIDLTAPRSPPPPPPWSPGSGAVATAVGAAAAALCTHLLLTTVPTAHAATTVAASSDPSPPPPTPPPPSAAPSPPPAPPPTPRPHRRRHLRRHHRPLRHYPASLTLTTATQSSTGACRRPHRLARRHHSSSSTLWATRRQLPRNRLWTTRSTTTPVHRWHRGGRRLRVLEAPRHRLGLLAVPNAQLPAARWPGGRRRQRRPDAEHPAGR